ncbi:MAG TPA: alternative ribosome rescue aminoacyl-tRNA hydrolase ArfB [Bacteroidales bacterium]|nr:alternative ribosome rescue aminoacyl-tRNA hydrolase ArfB [Bacteroidales bacterium]
MKPEELEERNLEREFDFSTSRSSGPGGQNVNKVNTKVELRFNIHASGVLTEQEKILILDKLKNRINADGELIVTSQTERTQLKNRHKVIQKCLIIISKALTVYPERKPTAQTRRSKEERLEVKRKRGYIKSIRKKIDETGNE